MSNQHHVVPDPEGGWKIKRSGSKRSSGNFETKTDAVNRGREVSQNQNTELVIHRRDGTIQQKDSHGRDNRRVRDRDTHK